MATLYISEYYNMTTLPNTTAQLVEEPPLFEQTIAIGGASAQSAAFQTTGGPNGNGTRVIRINTDAACSILIGTNPTAAITNQRLAANQTEYKRVQPGQKLAVIANS